MEIEVLDSADELILSLAKELHEYSRLGTTINIALSGGRTPKRLFEFIAQGEYAESIQWQNLHFWWGDERYVDVADPQSNFGEANRLLFTQVDIPQNNLHRMAVEEPAKLANSMFSSELDRCLPKESVSDFPQFDWVLLGIGEDGHTASLFPGQTDLLCKEYSILVKHPETGQERISITASVIGAAKRVTYMVIGRDKAKVTGDIINMQGDFRSYPAANISSTNGITQWYLDREAAAFIRTLEK